MLQPIATLDQRIYLHNYYLGRRLDGVEQKLNGQDQAQRNLMEQIMKLSQEMKVCNNISYQLVCVSVNNFSGIVILMKLLFYKARCDNE